jgi:hypothetical protein
MPREYTPADLEEDDWPIVMDPEVEFPKPQFIPFYIPIRANRLDDESELIIWVHINFVNTRGVQIGNYTIDDLIDELGDQPIRVLFEMESRRVHDIVQTFPNARAHPDIRRAYVNPVSEKVQGPTDAEHMLWDLMGMMFTRPAGLGMTLILSLIMIWGGAYLFAHPSLWMRDMLRGTMSFTGPVVDFVGLNRVPFCVRSTGDPTEDAARWATEPEFEFLDVTGLTATESFVFRNCLDGVIVSNGVIAVNYPAGVIVAGEPDLMGTTAECQKVQLPNKDGQPVEVTLCTNVEKLNNAGRNATLVWDVDLAGYLAGLEAQKARDGGSQPPAVPTATTP